MREFKFRAWDKENKRMLDLIMLGENSLLPNGHELENREDFIIMQYTGLKDRNGKEIYEGDIAEWVDNYGYIKETCQMIYNQQEGAFKGEYCTDGGEHRYVGMMNAEYGFRVIGNIYEDPELLG
jgi:uncharacterized phage protein (TIGR01671 family)